MTPLAFALSLPVRAYRLVLSPWLGHGCRFQPTCSAYAMEALERHGGLKGGWLAAHRICRCHPWGGQGYDPVPGADPVHDAMGRSSSTSCTLRGGWQDEVGGPAGVDVRGGRSSSTSCTLRDGRNGGGNGCEERMKCDDERSG